MYLLLPNYLLGKIRNEYKEYLNRDLWSL